MTVSTACRKHSIINCNLDAMTTFCLLLNISQTFKRVSVPFYTLNNYWSVSLWSQNLSLVSNNVWTAHILGLHLFQPPTALQSPLHLQPPAPFFSAISCFWDQPPLFLWLAPHCWPTPQALGGMSDFFPESAKKIQGTECLLKMCVWQWHPFPGCGEAISKWVGVKTLGSMEATMALGKNLNQILDL